MKDPLTASDLKITLCIYLVSRPLPPIEKEQKKDDAMEIDDDENTKVEIPIEQVIYSHGSKHCHMGILAYQNQLLTPLWNN